MKLAKLMWEDQTIFTVRHTCTLKDLIAMILHLLITSPIQSS